jgi:hypothetical protein
MQMFRHALTGLLSLIIVSAAAAHEGHDHGAPPPPVTTTIAPRAEASSAEFEAVIVKAASGVTIYLDRFQSNEPVPGASIEVNAPDGAFQAEDMGEGVYSVEAPQLALPGTHDLALIVTAGDLMDILTATLEIPQPEETTGETAQGPFSEEWAQTALKAMGNGSAMWLAGAGIAFLFGLAAGLAIRRRSSAVLLLAITVLAAAAPGPAMASGQAARDLAQRFADGSLFVPKATQRILAIRTVMTREESHRVAVELPGRIIPDPNGSGYVQASIAGRLVAPQGGFPRLGSAVRAGDVLALVEPAIGAADATGLDLQARELDQEIGLIQRRLERYRQIKDTVARAQIEDAELELAGLLKRREDLERGKRDPERLIAPVSGVVASASAVAGQIAEPNSVIFQIVDPGRFWVEALSYETIALEEEAAARLSGERVLKLAYRGSGLADRNQSAQVHFSIEDEAAGLRAGQLLTVLAATAESRSGVSVPKESVIRGANGQMLVYERTNAERFVPREVRVEPLDGDEVLLVSGVKAGSRIVTQGAELLNQIR